MNGHPAGAESRTAITLSRRAPGTNYNLGGYGSRPRLENIGPTPPGRVAVQSRQQRRWRWGSTFGIWRRPSCFWM